MKAKHIILILSLVIAITSSGLFASGDNEIREIYNNIKGENALKIISDLCAPEMEGRNSGTVGYNRAIEYILKNLKEMNLKPLYKNYLQKYTVPVTDITFSEASVEYGAQNKRITKKLELFKDYLPDMNSGFGKIKGQVVFAGYGITAPDNDWDDYRGIDVKGKIVIVLSGPPVVKGKNFNKYWGASDHKFRNALDRGAVAILRITSMIGVRTNRYIEGFPMLRLDPELAKEIFSSEGISIEEKDESSKLGEGLTHYTSINMEIEIKGKHSDACETANIVALLEGSDPELKNDYILIGAHLDHIGKMFKVFPGANDNASGCAVVMELARAFTKLENKPKRSIVFLFFGSEETGRLGGSTHVVNIPPYNNRLPKLMFNYDIVASGDRLLLSGGSLEDQVVQEMIEIEKEYAIGLKIVSVGDEHFYQSSDHTPFVIKGVQAYGNFSADAKWDFMHTEWDNLDAVEAEPMEKLIKLYFLLLNKKLNE